MIDQASVVPPPAGYSQSGPQPQTEGEAMKKIQEDNVMFKQAILNAISRKNAGERFYNKFSGVSTSDKRERDIKAILQEVMNMPRLAEYTVSKAFSDAATSMAAKSYYGTRNALSSSWNYLRGNKSRGRTRSRGRERSRSRGRKGGKSRSRK
jgi:hypothetical protein